MFNVGGMELLVIGLVALIVLGPDKLPGALRQAGKVMGELRRISAGFQTDLRGALEQAEREAEQEKLAQTKAVASPTPADGAAAAAPSTTDAAAAGSPAGDAAAAAAAAELAAIEAEERASAPRPAERTPPPTPRPPLTPQAPIDDPADPADAGAGTTDAVKGPPANGDAGSTDALAPDPADAPNASS